MLLCFQPQRRLHFTPSSSQRRTSTDVIGDPETAAQEYFYVAPNGLNIQVLSTNKEGEPVRSRANEITIADFMQSSDGDADNRLVGCYLFSPPFDLVLPYSSSMF